MPIPLPMAVIKTSTPVLILALAAILTLFFWISDPETSARFDAPQQQIPDSKAAGKSPDGAFSYFLDQRLGGNQIDIIGRLAAAREETSDRQPFSSILGRSYSSEKSNYRATLPKWEFLGPGNIGGRTRALVINPDNPQLMYAAGVSGGIWRSSDGGGSWHPLDDFLPSLAVVTLVMHPDDPDTLFAGTGEGVYVDRPITRSRGLRGDGVFVSRDAGETWAQLTETRNNPDFHYVNRLVFGNGGRLYAATVSGLWSSDDEGESWQRRLDPDNDSGCLEVAVQPQSDPDLVLVSCGNFDPDGVYRSADAGETWVRVLDSGTIAGQPGIGRTTLAFAPSQPDIVYALAAVSDSPGTGNFVRAGLLALYRSNDAGLSWALRISGSNLFELGSLIFSNPIFSVDNQQSGCPIIANRFGQGWFDNVLAVDPLDPETVWAGGVDLFRSDDGGVTWGLASYWWQEPSMPGYVHADQHALVFHPDYDGSSNKTLFSSNDGGLFRTEDALAATSTNACEPASTSVSFHTLNNGYGVTQFYHGSVFADGERYIGGAQDNGTISGTDAHGVDQWFEVSGGDGGYSAIDPDQPNTFYASSQFGFFLRTDDGGESFTDVSPANTVNLGSFTFIAPLAMDGNDSATIWTGGERLGRSRNRGETWQQASVILAPNQNQRVTAIAVSPADSNRVVAGTSQGLIATSGTALSTAGFSQWGQAQPASGWVSSVNFDPLDPAVVYATYSTFGVPHIWRSEDQGISWEAIDGLGSEAGIPDVPVHDLAVDPGNSSHLFAATELGLYVSIDRGETWAPDPFAASGALIEKLQFVEQSGDTWLYAFTYGRGVFRAIVSDLDTVAVTESHSGTWFNQDRSGEGFLIEISATQPDRALVYWFTYDDSGRQAWFFSAATVQGDRIIADPLLSTSGPVFGEGFDPESLQVAERGRLEIVFTACNSALYSYQIDATQQKQAGAQSLQRLSFVDGAECAPDTSVAVEPAISGSWYDPSHNGEGFLIQRQGSNADEVLVYWFTYDLDGNQAWLFNTGQIDGGSLTISPLISTSGPVFGPGYDPMDIVLEEWGSIEFNFHDCGTASASYSGPEAFGGGSFDLERLSVIAGCSE